MTAELPDTKSIPNTLLLKSRLLHWNLLPMAVGICTSSTGTLAQIEAKLTPHRRNLREGGAKITQTNMLKKEVSRSLCSVYLQCTRARSLERNRILESAVRKS